jgi:hypothetical protein
VPVLKPSESDPRIHIYAAMILIDTEFRSEGYPGCKIHSLLRSFRFVRMCAADPLRHDTEITPESAPIPGAVVIEQCHDSYGGIPCQSTS